MIASRLVSAAVVASLSSCASAGARGRSLSRAPEVRAAEGAVSFKRMDGEATAIEVRIRNLKEPDQLVPPGHAYVAWVQASREAPPRNLGSLNMAESGAELRALTALSCSELFITAEAIGDAERPTGRRLLWARCD